MIGDCDFNIRWLVADLLLWRFKIDSRPLNIGFVVGKDALGEVFPYQYHSIDTLQSFICLSLMLQNLSN